jgi:hypothetical protein
MASESNFRTPKEKKNPDGMNQSRALQWLSGLFGSIWRTTRRFFKNILPSAKSYYKRWRNERSRLPKRTTRSKAYLLVGYTTKENINNRYRAMKIQNVIRVVLLLSIIMLTVYILYKWLNPFGNTDELQQIIGVNKIEELTEDDPFAKDQSSDNLLILNDLPQPSTSDSFMVSTDSQSGTSQP